MKGTGPGKGMGINMETHVWPKEQMKLSQKRVKAEMTLDLLPGGQLIGGTLPKRLRNCDQKEEENQVSLGF